jgi:hypothetical protein
MYIYYYRRTRLPLALGGFISLHTPSFICQRIARSCYLFALVFLYFLFLISYWDELAFWLSSYSSAGITIKRERLGFYLFSCIYHIARWLLYANTTGHGLILGGQVERAISELAGLPGRGLNMIKLVWLSPSIFPHATSHPSFTSVSLIAHHSRHVTGPQMLHHSEAGWRKRCVGVASSVETVSLLSRLSSPGARDEHASAQTNLLKFSKLRGVSQKEEAE